MRQPRKPRDPSKRKPRAKYSAYVFTIFKLGCLYGDLTRLDKLLVYGVVGVETCPTTQKPHMQGYLYFKEPITPGRVRSLLKYAHIEPARKCPEANFLYCSKENEYDSTGSLIEATKMWSESKPPFENV